MNNKQPQHTLSFWLTSAAILAATRKQYRLASALLTIAGVGWLGVAWNRYTDADLRRIRDLRKFNEWDGLAAHGAMIAGAVALARKQRA